MPVPTRRLLPRLFVDCGDLLRTAKRLSGSRPRSPHGGQPRVRVFPVGRRMTDNLHRITDADLLDLARALRSHRLEPPYAPIGVQRVSCSALGADIAAGFQGLAGQVCSPVQIATTLEL